VKLLFLALAVASLGQTPDIHYVPTSDTVVNAMLEAAHVSASDVVYDLGSGDGRIVISSGGEKRIDVAIADAKKAWQGTFAW